MRANSLTDLDPSAACTGFGKIRSMDPLVTCWIQQMLSVEAGTMWIAKMWADMSYFRRRCMI